MPKYELMYIIGSQTSDDQIPQLTEEIKKFIEAGGGILENHEEPGKKKLAYPIKKSRIGHYVVDTFSAPSDQINEIEHRIRTSQNVIRHLIVNIDDALLRQEKDRVAQARLKLMRPKLEAKEKEGLPVVKTERSEKKMVIDLDAEIEKALDNEEFK